MCGGFRGVVFDPTRTNETAFSVVLRVDFPFSSPIVLFTKHAFPQASRSGVFEERDP